MPKSFKWLSPKDGHGWRWPWEFNIVMLLLAAVIFLEIALISVSRSADEPFQLPERWWTCPSGSWIKHGLCVPWHDGQDVEFGCETIEDSDGNVLRQTCPQSATYAYRLK